VIEATDVRSDAAEGFEDVYERCWTPMVRLAALTTGSVSVGGDRSGRLRSAVPES
jgi:hypothetical protein